MAGYRSTGKCTFCGGVFAKGSITVHLKACKARKATLATSAEKKGGKEPLARIYHIVVEGRDRPYYWMHLEMAAAASLKTLDQFLRDVWLECCGHLSAFTIEDSLTNPARIELGVTGA